MNSDSQADLIKAGIRELTRLSDLEAAQMVIDLKNGEIISVAISTSRDGQKAKCGAPAYYDQKEKDKKDLCGEEGAMEELEGLEGCAID
ncbi:hypothetical protein N7492_002808 [Penicillium capsulatum]|uniref:Uncharacterized protein n=1 Tax=Penicillium capsulatum TaxID=69766 RepID=A0A9W9IK26_9EURO|nr:hypothetical protein N7492_002808 [Penicillium capsulatum]